MIGDATELTVLLDVLDKIDRGVAAPSIPGRVGRFLRQYRTARAQIEQVLEQCGAIPRADAALSGRSIGAIELHALHPPQLSILQQPLGEVADALAVSEELGSLVRIRMWMKGPVANAVYNILRGGSGVRLSGDYRWTPPLGITPGEAEVSSTRSAVEWPSARCLKAVADDLLRSAHALEYMLDYQVGPPGLKHFRSVCARWEGEWVVMPALEEPRRLLLDSILPRAASALEASELAMLLIYREPWSAAWTVADAVKIDPDGAFGHAITWADFYQELDGRDVSRNVYQALRERMRSSGVEVSTPVRPSSTRKLLPIAREILRWIRGRS